MMRTYSAKPSDVVRKWYVLDASELPLGRLATTAASLLLGKGKPSVTSHIDVGDFVVIVNAEGLVVTGTKMLTKKYYHHSHYPGGLKEASLKEKHAADPTLVIMKAVRGMLPDNKLRKGRLSRLKVYAGSAHTHEAQNPQPISLKRSSK